MTSTTFYSLKFPKGHRDRHLKKARRHNGRNLVVITSKWSYPRNANSLLKWEKWLNPWDLQSNETHPWTIINPVLSFSLGTLLSFCRSDSFITICWPPLQNSVWMWLTPLIVSALEYLKDFTFLTRMHFFVFYLQRFIQFAGFQLLVFCPSCFVLEMKISI